MAEFIVGNDLSSYQGQIDWPTYKNNSNFVIMKSSEGVGHIDGWFGYNRTQARLAGIPHAFYHFARPDTGNSSQSEAQFFCNLVDGDPIRDGEVLCLDFEVQFGDAVNWCKGWLDFVSNHFNGIKPLIYMNQSTAMGKDWSPIVNAGYGLWIAAYTGSPTNNNFQTGKWPTAAIQQWTDAQSVPGIKGSVDGDVFFGDVHQFMSYGYKSPSIISTPAPEPPVTPPTQPEQPTPPVVTNPPPTVSTTVPTTSSDPTVVITVPPTETPGPSLFQQIKDLLSKLLGLLEKWNIK